MKKYLRVVTVLMVCLGMATACQKESVTMLSCLGSNNKMMTCTT